MDKYNDTHVLALTAFTFCLCMVATGVYGLEGFPRLVGSFVGALFIPFAIMVLRVIGR